MLNDTHIAGMSLLLVKVVMSCAIFMSLMRPFSTELLMESVVTFFAVTIIFLAGGFLGMGLARILKASKSEAQCWRFGLTFGNVGFMGIPVITAVFGYEGLFYVAMAMVSFNLLTFTIGVRMFEKNAVRPGPVSLFKDNPALVATIIGFVFFLTEFRLPVAIEGGIDLIAAMTSPISMILIGAIMAKQPLKKTLTDIRILPPNAIKLLVTPLLSLLVLRWFVPNPLMLGVIVTIMAMPPAANTVIFAEQYGGDADIAVRLVIVGTLLSVITIPLISLFL